MPHAKPQEAQREYWLSFLALPALLLAASNCQAEVSGGLDWSAWQRMPVLEEGRIMPLDTFARVR